MKLQIKNKVNSIRNEAFKTKQNLPKNKFKLITKLIAFLLALVIAMYLIGLITQFIEGIATKSFNIETISKNFFICIKYAFFFKYSKMVWFIAAVLCLIVFIQCFKFKDDKNFSQTGEYDSRGFYYSEKGDFGTNRKLTIAEMEEIFDLTKGTYLPDLKHLKSQQYKTILAAYENLKKSDIEGIENTNNPFPISDMFSKNPDIAIKKKNKSYDDIADQTIIGQEITPSNEAGRIITWAKDTYFNPNIFVVGSPGTRKTRCLSNNYILQALRRRESVVAVDTKGSLYSDFSKMALSLGYKVKILNLKDLNHSDGWNPLATLDTLEKIQVLCDTIISNTSGDSPDAFFDKAELSLLKALVTYVTIDTEKHKTDPSEKNLVTVFNMLINNTHQELANTFDSLKREDPSHPALLAWNVYLKAGDKLTPNIQLGLCNRLQLLQTTEVQHILSTNSIDTTAIGKEPTIVFLCFPDHNLTYSMISSLFMTFIYIDLVNYADAQPELILPKKVTMLLDEFCNIGVIPDFTLKISTIRSRGIISVVIIQEIPQIMSRYPNGLWEEIIGACDTFIFLGGNEPTTAKYVSSLTGDATISVQNRGLRYDINATVSTDNNGTNTRLVYTVGEILALHPEHQLVRVRGQQILECLKYDYSRHPDSKYIVRTNANKHNPFRENVNYKTTTSDVPVEKNEPPKSTETPPTNSNANKAIGGVDTTSHKEPLSTPNQSSDSSNKNSPKIKLVPEYSENINKEIPPINSNNNSTLKTSDTDNDIVSSQTVASRYPTQTMTNPKNNPLKSNDRNTSHIFGGF